MVRNQMLISVGLLVMLEVYLSCSFCDKCPKPQLSQGHDNQNDDEESLLDVPHAKYVEQISQSPQSTEEEASEGSHHRIQREAPRERSGRGPNRGKNRPKKKSPRHRPGRTVASPTPTMQVEQQQNFSNVCNICWMRERRRDHRIESIKNAVLEKLEMSHAPNISRPTLPDGLPPGIFGQDAFNKSYHPENPNDSNVDFEELEGTLQIVQFARAPPAEVNLGEPYLNSSIVYFKLESDVRNSKLHDAILFLYVLPQPENQGGMAFISIYQIIRGQNGEMIHKPQADKRIRVDLSQVPHGAWKRADVKHIVQRWIHHPTQENLGLYVVAIRSDGQTIAVLNPEGEEDKENKPLLKLEIDNGKKRSRREIDLYKDCDEHSSERTCCRFDLVVNFAELGWNWIYYPQRYHAYYCAGECNFSFRTTTKHGHIVGLTNTNSQQCCTAVKTSPMNVIAFDDNFNIRMFQVDDMIADRCGCN